MSAETSPKRRVKTVWTASEPHTCLRYICSPHHRGSALYPIVQRMEPTAGFEIGDDVQARLTARAGYSLLDLWSPVKQQDGLACGRFAASGYSPLVLTCLVVRPLASAATRPPLFLK
jgi:hypothetical protein